MLIITNKCFLVNVLGETKSFFFFVYYFYNLNTTTIIFG